ncbi:hypothetical protein EVA_12420 [gut metagenome]|uniref:Uncharacterized protein n=1 Tax=gut metagenome TaxID=749906 RepID=J9CHB2_9ZZZZ
MNTRKNHPEWPELTSDQLENKKRSGRNWVCTCPVCHTHHLNVDRQKGLFKCWYIGCEFRGILADYREKSASYRSGTTPHDRSTRYRSPAPAARPSPCPSANIRRTEDGDGWTGCYEEPDETTWLPLTADDRYKNRNRH